GLSFKPNTDDLRNAPALDIIKELKAMGSKIKVYDPQAMEGAKKIMPDIEYCQNAYETAKNSEALLICTDWDEFKKLDLDKLKQSMQVPIIFDGRNIFNAEEVRAKGIKYFGVGYGFCA
ncbi:MAG: UDP binding domain-containing protein, partial [Candidatus Omnitrophica bacterium]|nr:UDP binding domain-containing protein [Candidatus Omnitrophota bacterium]